MGSASTTAGSISLAFPPIWIASLDSTAAQHCPPLRCTVCTLPRKTSGVRLRFLERGRVYRLSRIRARTCCCSVPPTSWSSLPARGCAWERGPRTAFSGTVHSAVCSSHGASRSERSTPLVQVRRARCRARRFSVLVFDFESYPTAASCNLRFGCSFSSRLQT